MTRRRREKKNVNCRIADHTDPNRVREMKITDIRINGIKEPIGYHLPYLSLSWKVVDTEAKICVDTRIVLRCGEEIVYELVGDEIRAAGQILDFETAPLTRYDVTVEVTADNKETARGTTFFETGKCGRPWSAVWISSRPEDDFHPIFTRRFNISDKPVNARLYITGLGLYEAYINDRRVGDEYMTPYLSDYTQQVQYQTYDVGELLNAGENLIEIHCGNGWYKGRIGFDGRREVFGDRFCALAELVIKMTDGSELTIATDDSWTYRKSPVLMSDNYDGEIVDHTVCSGEASADQAVLYDPGIRVVERTSVPVRVMEDIAVSEVIRTPKGETVLDFGQNFTGFVEIRRSFPKGTRITLTCGEILQQGNFYRDNLRSAAARFEVISDGRAEPIHPHFTFCGFRYVKVEGPDCDIRPEDFCGRALYSDLSVASEFECSDERLNRLYLNALWGQKSNFLDMPTDCPQRDERLAWTGDIQVFAPTACFNMDARAFLNRFLEWLYADEKRHNGAVAGYLPDLGDNPRGACAWGDAATFIPMTMYEHYGNEAYLQAHYPLMKDWADWLIKGDKEHGDRGLWDFGFQFGDWLALDGITPQSMKGSTDDEFVASVYYYASLSKTAKAADILGCEADRAFYDDRARRVRDAILNEYYTPSGRLSVDTQTAYILSLRFGVYRDKDVIISGFKKRLKKDCYKIKGGFVGATSMLCVMAENGMEKEASYFLFQKGFPGWFHCIDLGATTIWERWNSVLDDGSVSGTGMNSLNHYAYGSVMEYVYRYLAGIQPSEPGFSAVVFKPQITWHLEHLRYAYDSVSGRYESEWTLHSDGRLTVRFTVPFGCAAKAVLPGNGDIVELEPGVWERTYMPDVDFRKKYSADTRLEELAEDDRALAVLKKHLPMAFGMATGDDIEARGLTLNDLSGMGYLGLDPDDVKMAVSGIEEIRL